MVSEVYELDILAFLETRNACLLEMHVSKHIYTKLV
jgi:hypothetical protein